MYRGCFSVWLVFLWGATAIGEMGNGTNVVYVYFEDEVNGDRTILLDAKKDLEKMRACGVTVSEVRGRKTSINDIALAAKSRKGFDKTLVWINSHGDIPDDEGGVLTRRGILTSEEHRKILRTGPRRHWLFLSENDTPLFQTDELMKKLPQDGSTAAYVDTCRSGRCSACTGVGILASCEADQTSTEGSRLNDTISDLLCSQAGDCRFWNSVDENGDGIINEREMTEHLQSFPKATRSTTATFPAADREKIAGFRKDHGDASVTERRASQWSLPWHEVFAGGKIQPGEPRPSSLLVDLYKWLDDVRATPEATEAARRLRERIRPVLVSLSVKNDRVAEVLPLAEEVKALADRFSLKFNFVWEKTLTEIPQVTLTSERQVPNAAPDADSPPQTPVIKGFELKAFQCKTAKEMAALPHDRFVDRLAAPGPHVK